MPARYEAIKKSMLSRGLSDATAKASAARIFNSQRGKGVAPVTGKNYDKDKEKGGR